MLFILLGVLDSLYGLYLSDPRRHLKEIKYSQKVIGAYGDPGQVR